MWVAYIMQKLHTVFQQKSEKKKKKKKKIYDAMFSNMLREMNSLSKETTLFNYFCLIPLIQWFSEANNTRTAGSWSQG